MTERNALTLGTLRFVAAPNEEREKFFKSTVFDLFFFSRRVNKCVLKRARAPHLSAPATVHNGLGSTQTLVDLFIHQQDGDGGGGGVDGATFFPFTRALAFARSGLQLKLTKTYYKYSVFAQPGKYQCALLSARRRARRL